jgi:predicted Zn-ribbon and HTH transcriptional regulator
MIYFIIKVVIVIKYDIEYLKDYLSINHPHFHLISQTYTNCKDKLEFVCDIHKEKGVQYKSVDKLIHRGSGCRYCGIEKQRSSLRIDDNSIMQRCIELNLEYVDRFIKNKETWVNFLCPNHITKGIQSIAWYHLKECAIGCAYCTGRYKTTDDFIKELKLINNDIEIVGGYEGSEIPIQCKCKKCGHIWSPIARSLKNNQGCPNCASSKGENKIYDYLKLNNIKFETQRTFKNCVHKGKLKFDFYLFEFNICIEYDGIQHYQPVDFANKGEKWASNQFKSNLIKDKIKTDYCINNNIKLIRIPYWEFNNIEKILDSEFSELFLCKNIS